MNYACTSMSCQLVLEYSKVDIRQSYCLILPASKSFKKQSRDILSKQVKMTTFNGSEVAAGNDELYLAS
jgi:hypothetical protein